MGRRHPSGVPVDGRWGRQEGEEVQEGGHVRGLRYTLRDEPAAMTTHLAKITALDACPGPVTDTGWRDDRVTLFLEMDDVVLSGAEQLRLAVLPGGTRSRSGSASWRGARGGAHRPARSGRLIGFIERLKAALAVPFRWTYAGKPLQA